MGNVLEFIPRPAGADPQRELLISIEAVQWSLAETARILASNIDSLNETLEKIEHIILHIDDTETREKLRRQSESIHLQLYVASQKL